MTTSRQPIPRDDVLPSAPTNNANPSPPVVRPGLREPDDEFIRNLSAAIRSGVAPGVAAEWLGVSRKRFQRWVRSHANLRAAVRAAKAHLRVKLELDLTTKHPDRALRRLDAHEEAAEAGRSYSQAPRPYSTGSGHTLVSKALPHLIERVTDMSISDDALSPVERVAREWHRDAIADLGGPEAITTARRALLRACLGSVIIMSSLYAHLLQMAATDGLVSRKHRRVFPVVESRMRIADSLTRQLQALGLDRAKPTATDLEKYLATHYGNRDDAQRDEQQHEHAQQPPQPDHQEDEPCPTPTCPAS